MGFLNEIEIVAFAMLLCIGDMRLVRLEVPGFDLSDVCHFFTGVSFVFTDKEEFLVEFELCMLLPESTGSTVGLQSELAGVPGALEHKREVETFTEL